MVSLNIMLFIYYVVTLNIDGTAGFEIGNIEREKRQLIREKQLLTSKIADLASGNKISNDAH
jgi:hypothetical protein